jgi:hypothetical protein
MLEGTEESVLLDRDELFEAMCLTAYLEACGRLSSEGEEVLRMFVSAEDMGMDVVEAYKEAIAFDHLSQDDQATIEVYLARTTLIEEFRGFEG